MKSTEAAIAMSWQVMAMACTVTGFALASEPVQPPADDFSLVVTQFWGVEGRTLSYRFSPSELVIHLSRDDKLGGPAEKHRSNLTPAEVRSVASALMSLPLSRLRSEYEDPTVDDGLVVSFDIQVSGSARRHIRVANVEQSELINLCRVLRNLIPEPYRLGWFSGGMKPGG